MALFLLLPLLASGCENAPTEIVVVVDTDLAVPRELDEIGYEVRVGDEPVAQGQVSMQDADAPALPATLGLRPGSSDPDPLSIRMTGYKDSQPLLEQRAKVLYVRGETRMLVLELLCRCASKTCPEGNTCGADGCIDEARLKLPPWNGPSSLPEPLRPHCESGAPCGPSEETCNGVDDDCDGSVDEELDIDSGCQPCEAECELPHALARCAGGTCEIEQCEGGWANCDRSEENGCETELGTREDCEGCGDECAEPRICARRSDGSAQCVDRCPGDLEQCAGSCTSTSVDPSNCGQCGRVCEPREYSYCDDGTCVTLTKSDG